MPVNHPFGNSGYDWDEKWWAQTMFTQPDPTDAKTRVSNAVAQCGGVSYFLRTAAGKSITQADLKAHGFNPGKGVVEDLKAALQVYARLPKEQRVPETIREEERGPFKPNKYVQKVELPKGTWVLTGYSRFLGRDGESRPAAFAPWRKDVRGFVPGEMTPNVNTLVHNESNWSCDRDQNWFTKEEARAFFPQGPTRRGASYEVPAESLGLRRLLIHGTSGQTPLISGAQSLRPDSLVLKGEVEETDEESVRVRLEGAVVMVQRFSECAPEKRYANYEIARERGYEGRYDARILGKATLNRKNGEIRHFNLVVYGGFTGLWYGTNHSSPRRFCLTPLRWGFAFDLDSWGAEAESARGLPYHLFLWNMSGRRRDLTDYWKP